MFIRCCGPPDQLFTSLRNSSIDPVLALSGVRSQCKSGYRMSFRVLVTGSSGFIGSIVISALAAAGHNVRAASRRPPKAAAGDRIEWMELPDLEQEVDWGPLLDGMDIVVHLAAIAHRGYSDSVDYASANRVATASLAKACRSY